MTFTSTKAALLRSTVIAGLALAAAPLFAQAATGAQTPSGPAPQAAANQVTGQAAAAAEDSNTIVVTGTLIRNPSLVASSPVQVVNSAEIDLKQSNNAEELLRDVPGIVPSIGSAVNNGNGGASLVNLRGLGDNRNLVLLDGRRVTPAGLVGSVDLNNLPLALIDNVQVLTGGATTTYGADAVAGVVNFITKKDFSGVELNLGDSISQRGDGNTIRADLTIGANVGGGRGNVVLSVGYQKQDPIYQGDRDFGIQFIDSFSGLPGGSGTTVPTRINGSAFNGTPLFGSRQIDPVTGRLLTAAQSPNGAFIGFNYNPYNLYQTPFIRYNIFAQGRYEIADNIEVYAQGLFSKNTVSTIIAPSGTFGNNLTIPLSNPFLPTAARNQICAAAGLSQAACDAAAANNTPGTPGYQSFTANFGRRFVEAGTRNSDYVTTLFQYQAGIRGDITSGLKFDVFGQYGESTNQQTQSGNGLLSRLTDSANATGTGCVSGNAGCVPINLFGPAGSITQAQLAYITGVTTTSQTVTTLGIAGANISGDFGLVSPGATAPVGIAVGIEYRRYTAGQSSDLPTSTPGEVLGNGAATPPSNGTYNVKEAFGELNIPLIQDKPGFKNLTLELGGRVSGYSERGVGTVYTWKAGGSYEPFAGLKFRGNYQRAVRAPNIFELFSPQVVGLGTLSVDPCAGAAPTFSANLAAICIAQGAPPALIGQIQNPSSSQPNIAQGGNPNLATEKATTVTVGGVLTPSFVRGFSLSVDYFNIHVDNAISTPNIGDVINGCFGNITAASAASLACTQIRRNPATGGLDGSSATTPGVPLPFSNVGKIQTDGIDVGAAFRYDLGPATLNLGGYATWTFRNKFQASPTAIYRECTGYFSPNCGWYDGSLIPRFQLSQRTSLTFGKVDLSLLWRHLSGFRQEPDDVVNGNGPACGSANPCGAGQTFDRIGSKDYFDLSLRVDATERMIFTFTVRNLADLKPPLVGSNVGTTAFNNGNTYPSTYDAIGRRFAAGVRLKF